MISCIYNFKSSTKNGSNRIFNSSVMKPTILLVISTICIFIFFGCNDDNEGFISLREDLNMSANLEGNSVQINWTLSKITDFQYYAICRSTNRKYYDYSYLYESYFDVFYVDDYNTTNYTDDAPYTIGTNYYWIMALCSYEGEDGYTYTTYIKSNLDSVSVTDITTFNQFPKKVIYYPDENLLGLNNRYSFTLYNYSSDKIIGSVAFNSYQNSASMGLYNNNLEVYLSKASGTIDIYNASNMSHTESLSYNNFDYAFISMAANNNGSIYATTYNTDSVYIFNRGTGEYSSYHCYEPLYLAYDEANNLLFGIEGESYPYLYQFNLNNIGEITSSKNDQFRGYHYSDLKVDPYSDKLYILPDPLVYKSSSFTETTTSISEIQDIAFTEDKIYIAPFEAKVILEIDKTNSSTNTINLPGYPVYIFVDENELIALITEDEVSYSSAKSSDFKGYSYNTSIGIYKVELSSK